VLQSVVIRLARFPRGLGIRVSTETPPALVLRTAASSADGRA